MNDGQCLPFLPRRGEILQSLSNCTRWQQSYLRERGIGQDFGEKQSVLVN